MIINIRGTGGSGKSWVVKQVMSRFSTTLYDPISCGHVVNGNTFVLGPYSTGLSTEGTDVVNRKDTQDGIQQRLLDAVLLPGGSCDNLTKENRGQEDIQKQLLNSRYPNALFEGLLVSGIYGRYRDMARTVPDYRWVFLNTPLQECLDNTKGRRIAAGKIPEFNPKATEDKYRSVRSILRKCREDDLNHVYDVSSIEAVNLIASWINPTVEFE